MGVSVTGEVVVVEDDLGVTVGPAGAVTVTVMVAVAPWPMPSTTCTLIVAEPVKLL